MRIRHVLVALSLLATFPDRAQPATITYFSEAAFLAAVGPTVTFATSTFGPALNFNGISANVSGQLFHVDSTLGDPFNNLSLADFTDVLAGNEIAVAGADEVDVSFLPSAVYAFGFQFAEPTSSTGPDSASPFIDSIFEVSLFIGATHLESLMFNATNDAAAFVGVWSSSFFNKVSIVEVTADSSDEFIGNLYVGQTPLELPEPASMLLLGAVAASLLARHRRRWRSRVC